MSAIEAIPCDYSGVHMRSRLEGRWAAFFDGLGTPWQYEPATYRMRGQRWQYTPDFHLPDIGTIVEVKPRVVDDPDLADKYASYGPELIRRGKCRLFVFVLRSPCPGVAYAAYWKYGERTFNFADVFGGDAVDVACNYCQSIRFADIEEPAKEKEPPWTIGLTLDEIKVELARRSGGAEAERYVGMSAQAILADPCFIKAWGPLGDTRP